MAKKITLLSVVMLFLGITTFAQSGSCGFDLVHKKLMLTSHGYENAVRTTNNDWIESRRMLSKAKLTLTSAGYIYEIPIVIQVIHTGGAVGTIYNPDSATLAGMVSYLNKAYAATAPFPDTTTGASGGGTRIPLKFILAKRTPAGGATNGIVRYDASALTNYVNFGINADSVRGLNPDQVAALSRWDPASYYNVYVVNKIDSNDLTKRGGIAGFAYFPGFPTVDAMYVVATQARTGSTTVAHEFGHAYSLYHTFEGDGGGGVCPSPETDCTTQNDMVCDTEPHKRSSSWGSVSPFVWCPPNDVNPCTGKSYNNVQHNIMDYTQCPPDRFTKGQRDRVLNVISGTRSGFKTSAGLLAPSGTVIPGCPVTGTTATSVVGPIVVVFNDLNVWTGSASAEGFPYVDHAYTQQTQLEKGIPYTISVTTSILKQNVKAFIDLNNDGDFADAGEEVFSHTGTTSGPGVEEVHSGSITIPATVTTCQWLRMRVVAATSTTAAADFPCGPYTGNAQAEDYAIYVKNRTAADTVTIYQSAGTNPSCTGASVTFSATPKAGTTYRWFVNGNPTAVTTTTYTSTTLANNDVITCKIYYTGSCSTDSAVSNAITLGVSSTVPAKAGIAIRTGSNPGCAGLPLTFEANVISGGPTPHYQWKVDNVNVGTDVDTYATSGLASGSKVWCVVTPNSSCSTTPVNSDTIVISYGKVVPSVRIGLTSVNPSCDSTMLNFTSNAIDAGTTPQYAWFVNGVPQPGATADTYNDAFLKNNDTVRLRIIANHPCIVPGVGDTAWSDSVIVLRNPKVMPTLSVAITYGANPGCIDSLLEFTATYTDGGGSPNVIWYVNGTLTAYGPIFASAAFNDNDVVVCKLEATPGACNTVDSLLSAPVTVKRSAVPATPVISLIGNMLVSSLGSDIQWYGPDGLIPGAVTGTYHPVKKGNYYAVSNNNGCLSPASNVLNVALLSISPANMGELHIYPNPSTGNITLDWGAERVNAFIDIYTITGQKVYSSNVDNDTRKAIDLSALGNGNYVIVIHDHEGKTGTATITLSR